MPGPSFTRCTVQVVALAAILAAYHAPAATLEEQLLAEGSELLAKAARREGDATHGAAIFFRQELKCVFCHTTTKTDFRLGPDLTLRRPFARPDYLADSLLRPSRFIVNGYEAVSVATFDGKIITGIHVRTTADVVELRDISTPEQLTIVRRQDVDERNDDLPSLMPTGLVNELPSREEFLDLLRYLVEVAEKGPIRASELKRAADIRGKNQSN